MAAVCNRCGKYLGMIDKRYPTQDGLICGDCLSSLGYDIYAGSFITSVFVKDKSFSQIERVAERREEMQRIVSSFDSTYEVTKAAQFNDNTREMLLAERVDFLEPYLYELFSYEQLIGCEIIENGNSSDAAIAGGVFLGATGAIMGATMKTCDQLEIKLTLKDSPEPVFYIKLIGDWNKTGVGSDSYKKKVGEAQDIVAKLNVIINENQLNRETAVTNNQGNTASATSSIQTQSININPNSVEPTITRIGLFLEDHEWDRARAYAEAALDYFPTESRLYLALLCVDARVDSFEELRNTRTSFKDNNNYKKALRFADESTIEFLKMTSAKVEENEDKERRYASACQLMQSGDFETAIATFQDLGDYKDSCDLLAESTRKYNENIKAVTEKEQKVFEAKAQREDKLRRAQQILKERETILGLLTAGSIPFEEGICQIEEKETELLRLVAIRKENDYYWFNCSTGSRTFRDDKWEETTEWDCKNQWKVVDRKNNYILFLDSSYSAEMGTLSYGVVVDNMLGNNFTYNTILELFMPEYRDLLISPCDVFGDDSLPNTKTFILSKDEIEKVLPRPEERRLPDKIIKNGFVEWLVRKALPKGPVPIIDEYGQYKEKRGLRAFSLNAQIRPAFWLDLSRIPALIESQNESFDDSTHTRHMISGYMLTLPSTYKKVTGDSTSEQKFASVDGQELSISVTPLNVDAYYNKATLLARFETLSMVTARCNDGVAVVSKAGLQAGTVLGCYMDFSHGRACTIMAPFATRIEGKKRFVELQRILSDIEEQIEPISKSMEPLQKRADQIDVASTKELQTATSNLKKDNSNIYICPICGYQYNPSEHENVAFETLPADWSCPICRGASKSSFKKEDD